MPINLLQAPATKVQKQFKKLNELTEFATEQWGELAVIKGSGPVRTTKQVVHAGSCGRKRKLPSGSWGVAPIPSQLCIMEASVRQGLPLVAQRNMAHQNNKSDTAHRMTGTLDKHRCQT